MWAKHIYYLLALCTWLTPCIGDATNLALINLTPYDLIQSKKSHSYQMASWDDAFPSKVSKSKSIYLVVG